MGGWLTSLTMVTILGSVFSFSLVAQTTLRQAYDRYQERYLTQSVGDLSNMFIFMDGATILVLNICAMAIFSVLGFVSFGPIVGVLGAIGGFFTPLLVVRHFRRRRIQKFDRQLVEALGQMAGALKAGLTFQQAMEQISRDSEPPLSQEFGLAIRELKLGVPIEDALINLSRRVGSPDLELMVTSTNIAKQLGGNMADMFDTIAGTIRERLRIEGKIQAMTSQGKMQGVIVSLMPVAIGIAINLIRPDLMGPMLHHVFGYIVVGVCALGVFLGWVMIMRIVSIDV